ncbi:MAG: hypothetical protein WA231_24665, partial [Methylocella sp.]
MVCIWIIVFDLSSQTGFRRHKTNRTLSQRRFSPPNQLTRHLAATPTTVQRFSFEIGFVSSID